MKATAVEIEDKVDKLVVVLDKDIQHIQEALSQLNELRSLVIKRDEVALGKLLERIRVESDGYTANELKRGSIRKELAHALGCDFEQMTLSRLEAALPKERKAQVTQRKTELRSLSKELRKEHLSTALLLSECARFNRLLLNSIFDFGKIGTITYDSNGATNQHADTAFVNLHF
jgi:flagellar biosynthesis/type III secretory pathway chaperone